MARRPIYTIGHSSHDLARFLELLAPEGIELVVDVRSQPYSRRWPQFRRGPLDRALQRAGLAYRFLGARLGGIPPEPDLHDDGRPSYERLRKTGRFADGLTELVTLATERTTTLLCAEEDPTRCHRHLLIAPALTERGFEVLHIRGDGRLMADSTLRPAQWSCSSSAPDHRS